jgi:thermostable 8-oxoguanine DNA glycosylase
MSVFDVDFNDDSSLERWALFCVLVAGHDAQIARASLDRFLAPAVVTETPFEYIRYLVGANRLESALQRARTGQYRRYTVTFGALAHSFSADTLRTCTVEQLECVYGIGPKTARFFLLSTRPESEYAALDTHILKELAARGHKVPKSTPTSRGEYGRLEKIVLEYARSEGLTPAEWDYRVWSRYARQNQKGGSNEPVCRV